MNDIVYKINYVLLKNKEHKQRKENDEKNKRIIEFSEECRRLVNKNEEQSREEILNMEKRINELESEIKKVTDERDFYKNSLYKIPRFFLKIFGVSKNENLIEK